MSSGLMQFYSFLFGETDRQTDRQTDRHKYQITVEKRIWGDRLTRSIQDCEISRRAFLRM